MSGEAIKPGTPLFTPEETRIAELGCKLHALKTKAEALARAMENIELRTNQHPDNDLTDQARNCMHANAIARQALAAYRESGQ